MRLLSLVVLCALLPAGAVQARSAAKPGQQLPHFTVESGSGVLVSTGSQSGFKNTAVDTFCLYGGPGSLLGKFQDPTGTVPDMQSWTGVDLSEQIPGWQVSQFNAESFGPPGNHAMWAGRSALQEPGWISAPGYGNSWDQWISYTAPVSDPSSGQLVNLQFRFNYDTEAAYDFFIVEYDSAGTQIPVLNVTGTNKDTSGLFTPLLFPVDVAPLHAIEYSGNDYGGSGTEIVIRMRATSDGAWSDEDGLFDGDGHTQVDEIQVTHADGVSFEDFEGGGPYEWEFEQAPYAGDFAKVHPVLIDLDPCVSNITPSMAFIDDATGPYNASYVGPGTGGTTSPNWSYGHPSGWVVNYNGGVSFGYTTLANEAWSPEIDWDLPGAADDGPTVKGAKFKFAVWSHMPLLDGMFYQWHVRSRDTNTGIWTPWENRSFVYYLEQLRWVQHQQFVTDLLTPDPDRVQISLGVYDFAQLFAFPGTDATPAPWFDNVSFNKFTVNGPSIVTRHIDLFQDSFAQSGQNNVASQANRDQLDVRIDMARDISTGGLNTPGDSIIVDATPLILGTTVTNTQLHYSLNMNPVFEPAIRGNTSIGTTSVGTGIFGWDQVEGTVNGQQSTLFDGTPVADRYFFDLPDVDFMYPGDVLEYYISATDNLGNTATLPVDLHGYDDVNNKYNRIFTMSALPTYHNTAGDHPTVIWINHGQRNQEEVMMVNALPQIGLYTGVDIDIYNVQGRSSLVSNGIGSAGAHGATPAQMSGYDRAIVTTGHLSASLSNGSSTAVNDKSDDIGLLQAWHDQPFDRCVVYFGEDLCDMLNSNAPAYLTNTMGVVFNDGNVNDEIGFQTSPHVFPTGLVAHFTSDFIVYGGCPGFHDPDSIDPGIGAVRAHGYEIAGSGGSLYVSPAASVYYDRIAVDLSRKIDVTFPYAFEDIRAPSAKGKESKGGEVAQQGLQHPAPPPPPPDFGNPSSAELPSVGVAVGAYPNPFNPRTQIELAVANRGPVVLQIYNLRGELVRTLVNGPLDAGVHQIPWHGVDDAGAEVASGVYMARATAEGKTEVLKIAVVR